MAVTLIGVDVSSLGLNRSCGHHSFCRDHSGGIRHSPALAAVSCLITCPVFGIYVVAVVKKAFAPCPPGAVCDLFPALAVL